MEVAADAEVVITAVAVVMDAEIVAMVVVIVVMVAEMPAMVVVIAATVVAIVATDAATVVNRNKKSPLRSFLKLVVFYLTRISTQPESGSFPFTSNAPITSHTI